MPSIEDWGRNAERRPAVTLARAAVAATAIVLLCVGLVGLVTTGSVFFSAAAAKRTVGARLAQQVYTPENAAAQISFFHDACQGVNRDLRVVESNQARLVADQQAARYATDAIRQQQAVQSLVTDEQDVTGARDALAGDVAAYNSRSAQSIANVFRGHGLPTRIDLPAHLRAGLTVNCDTANGEVTAR